MAPCRCPWNIGRRSKLNGFADCGSFPAIAGQGIFPVAQGDQGLSAAKRVITAVPPPNAALSSPAKASEVYRVAAFDDDIPVNPMGRNPVQACRERNEDSSNTITFILVSFKNDICV
jgi:hypothetical protein